MPLELKIAYKCKHCSKLYQRAHACLNHESYCKNNPEMKSPCQECKFLENKKVNYVFVNNYHHGEIERSIDLLYCNKLNKLVAPKFVQKFQWYRQQGLVISYDENNDEITNELMPDSCDSFKERN